ncbi:unnamed protein product [marine sediment metagenome]|uniref:Uncharacterized protein n=1 Tax=marine sediment metagenome TaxID=412755 RepID=X1K5I8_9ZZZZ
MKRIFTKVFAGKMTLSSSYETKQPAALSWLAQESYDILGASGVAWCDAPNENDGFAWITAELSQVGIADQDGSILKVTAGEGWNTVPQGIHGISGHNAVMFPDGSSVPLREEGYLYLNLLGMNKSAGQAVFGYAVTVYYTKKGSR